jgi:hypothetical protein
MKKKMKKKKGDISLKKKNHDSLFIMDQSYVKSIISGNGDGCNLTNLF